MAYYCVSDIRDSLDFLIPPVKNTRRKKEREKNYHPDLTRQPDNYLIRKLRKSKYPKYDSSEATDTGATSTSVVIKKAFAKISKRKFVTDKFFKEDTSGEIPLIKVTVIPKAVETQTSRLFNKRRQTVKRVQSTVSNQESSLRSKNIYLVVTGRKADKIYEIKTTESEKLSGNQSPSWSRYEDKPFDKLSNYKKVIESLNMDKKKKKDRRKRTISPKRNDSRSSLINEIFEGAGIKLQECVCSNNKRKEPFNEPTRGRSRVQIIGELGLSNEDKYLFNYAASINGHPVMKNCSQLDHGFEDDPSESIFRRPKSTDSTTGYSASKHYFRNQRDSIVQANLLDSATTHRPFSKNHTVRHESQGVQVDLEKISPSDKNKINSSRDQTIQCYCNCSNVTGAVSCTTETKSTTVKKVESPLVIISVYPKHDSADKLTSSHTLTNKRRLSPNRNSNLDTKDINKDRTKINLQRSRSPSPMNRMTKENNLNQVIDTRFLSTKKKNFNYRSTSSNRTKKESTPTEVSNKTSKSKTRTDFLKKFPVTFGSRASKDANKHSVTKKNITSSLQSPLPKKDIGSSFSRSGSPTIKKKEENNRKTISNQNNTNINFGRRKVFRSRESRKLNDDYDYGSMENFLMLSENNKDPTRIPSQTRCCSNFASCCHRPQDPRRRNSLKDYSFCSTTANCPTSHDTCCLMPSTSAIYETSQHTNADGVGYSGRNEDGRKREMITQTSRSYNRLNDSQSNTNFFAPIKHYHGDSCKVVDPFERDKEIRRLLGLQGRHITPQPVKHDCYSGLFSRDTQQRPKKSGVKISNKSFTCACISRTLDCKCCSPEKKPSLKHRLCKLVKTKTNTTQCDLKSTPASTLATSSPTSSNPRARNQEISNKQQQLILNRNIQVYLQIEQFSKQKPIMLTRKQYDKLKKTIQSTVKLKPTKQESRSIKNIFKTYSIVSEGKVKKASKNKNSGVIRNKGMQTHRGGKKSHKQMTANTSNQSRKSSCVCVEVQTLCNQLEEKKLCNYVLLDKQDVGEISKSSKEDMPRQTMSSLEIRCASVVLRRVTFSSTGQIATESGYSNEIDSSSPRPLFIRQNAPTPNLGTSVYSLYSEATRSGQSFGYLLSPRDSKQRKPFLRRLISCLVMHSARASNVKTPCGMTSKISGVNSSIDPYDTSTSLGAIELTSSMYDTSASFYSDHTILPINKIKRGFLSSVRGFLTNRRS